MHSEVPPSGSTPFSRPIPDPSDPASLGTHLRYIASDLHSVMTDMKEVKNDLGRLTLRVQTEFASASGVQAVAARVDQLEAVHDREIGAAPALSQTMNDVREIRRTIDAMQGGMNWLKTAIFTMAIPLALLIIAMVTLILKLVNP